MKKWLRRLLIGLGAFLGLLVVVVVGAVLYVQLTWDRPYNRPVPQLSAPTDPKAIARGEDIFKYTGVCWGCHGSETDINVLPAGGREFDLTQVGPPGGLGVFYAANLTPDPETGLGGWSDGEIIRALQEGVDREGRVLTLMPFQWYRGMSDADLLAIVAYIKSLPPVRNPVPANRPSFVSKALTAFKLIKPQPSLTEAIIAPTPGPTIEYGKYLSSHLSDCADCHTPRNLQTFQSMEDRPFTGGNIAFEEEGIKFYVPNLTPDRETGIGTWSEDQFLSAIRTGVRPNGTVIMPIFMPWLIYKNLTDDDLRAIYRYLRSLPAASNQVPTPQIAPGLSGAAKGKAVYRGYCAPCHAKEGGGTFLTRVPLRQAAPALDPRALEQIIRNGVAGTLMPGFAQTLSGEELAALLQFLRSWEGQ